MLTYIKSFDSIVNKVSLWENNNNLIVKKEFGTIAHKTGIVVPYERAQIEYNILNYLTSISQEYNHINIPSIVDFNAKKSILYTKYIYADKMIDIISNYYPEIEIWEELVKFIIEIQLSNSNPEILFNNLLEIQQLTKSIIYNYKLKIKKIDYKCTQTFCLGDLSLSNTLFNLKSNQLSILDFEFAHIGEIGYDLGQLSGQLSSINKKNTVLEDIINKIDYTCKSSYSTEQFENFLFWKKNFKLYYTVKTQL